MQLSYCNKHWAVGYCSCEWLSPSRQQWSRQFVLMFVNPLLSHEIELTDWYRLLETFRRLCYVVLWGLLRFLLARFLVALSLRTCRRLDQLENPLTKNRPAGILSILLNVLLLNLIRFLLDNQYLTCVSYEKIEYARSLLQLQTPFWTIMNIIKNPCTTIPIRIVKLWDAMSK